MRHLLLFNLKTDAHDDILGFTTDWINALAAHCERVTVITMFAGAIATAPNVRVLSVGREHGWSEPRRLVTFYRHLLGVLRTDPPDACFAHMIPVFAVLAWPLLKPRGIPLVLWYTHSATPPMLKLAHALVDRVVSASPSGFRLPSRKVRFIGHGIDPARFRPADAPVAEGPLRVLCLGRLSPIKHVEVVIAAVAEARRRRPDLAMRLAVVGAPASDADRAYEGELRAQVAREGLAEMVAFEGPIAFTDVHARYRAADAYVNASDTDSVDKAVLEAMSSGLPIVTSNVAFRDVLDAELAGAWVVPKGDAGAIADRLIALAEMGPEGRRALGARLRAVVAGEHGLPALARKLMAELGAPPDPAPSPSS